MVADRKDPDPRPQPRRDGHRIIWPVFRYRVLFVTGEVVDVEAVHDDSVMRGLVVELVKGGAIAGITSVAHVAWTDGTRVDDEAF